MKTKSRTYKCQYANVLDTKRKEELNRAINRRAFAPRFNNTESKLRFHLTTPY